MKKLLSIVLTLTMMLSMSVYVSASDSGVVSCDINGETVTVQVLGNNALLVTEGSEKSLITVSEKNNVVTTTLKNMSTGEEDVFIRDNNAGTLYSSITGYTGVLSASATEAGTYRIPYQDLAPYVDAGATAAQVLSAICSAVGYEAAAQVLTLVENLLTIISNGLTMQSRNKGIEYTLEWRTIHKHQGGHDFYIDVLKIVDLDTY